MARICTLLVCLSGVFLFVTIAQGQESVYPTGAQVAIRYSLNTTVLSVSDTLVITRTLINRSSRSLTGLYFSDNFPPAFVIAGHNGKANTTSILVGRTTPEAGAAITGYAYTAWMVDSPVPGENYHRAIAPGDSVTLEIKITCSAAGAYTLPFHTTACHDGSTGIFATSSAPSVTFTPADITPPAAIIDLGDIQQYKAYRVVRRFTTPGIEPERGFEIAI